MGAVKSNIIKITEQCTKMSHTYNYGGNWQKLRVSHLQCLHELLLCELQRPGGFQVQALPLEHVNELELRG